MDFFASDVTEPENLSDTLGQIVRDHGPPTHLVFFQRYRNDGDSWQGSLDTGLTGTRETIEHLVEDFPSDGSAAIVLVASIATDLVADDQPLGYHVVKAGMEQMARFYAARLGGKGIRVNCVSPGIVLKERAREFYDENPELKEVYEDVTPLGRMAEPADIVDVIEFLLSPEARFVTGQNIVVDGGASLSWQADVAQRFAGPSE